MNATANQMHLDYSPVNKKSTENTWVLFSMFTDWMVIQNLNEIYFAVPLQIEHT